MEKPLNLSIHRSSVDGFAASSSGNYQTAFTLLAVPLAFALGFVAFRTGRLRPLASAFAVMGIARSAAQLLKNRKCAQRDERLDRSLEESFPASDAPAFQP